MDFKLFSADDHVDMAYLPSDLWTKRVPSNLRERVPRRMDTQEGERWVVNGKDIIDRTGPRPFGKRGLQVEHPSGQWRPTTPSLRLADMDRDGIESQVLFGGFIPNLPDLDPELNSICINAYNSWIAEFSSDNPDRLIGLGCVPGHDGESAVRELYHCVELGLKGIQFNPFQAARPIWHETWDPLWSAANETGLPINFHLGGGQWSAGRWMPGKDLPGVDPSLPTPTGGSQAGAGNRGAAAMNRATVPSQLDEVLCSLILCGAMDRNPNLKVVLAESSIGWIPYMLEKLDRKYQEMHIDTQRDDAPDLEMMPSGYWYRQMYATFQEDPVGMRLLDLLGPQNVMWASDYPHPDSLWPESHPTVDLNFKGIDPKITRMILRENGVGLYS